MAATQSAQPKQVSMTRGELDHVIADKLKANRIVHYISIALVAIGTFLAATYFGADNPVTVSLNGLQAELTAPDGTVTNVEASGTIVVPAGSNISLTDAQ